MFLLLGTTTLKRTTQNLHKEFGDARDNAAMILEFSNVCPFRHQNTFGCAYCPYTSPDFGPIKRHTKEHMDRALAIRNVEGSSVCKVDVTDLRCEICQQSTKNISTLFEHLIEAHKRPLKRDYSSGVVPYLLNDGFTCADCGATFDVFRNLNCHMNVHYPHFICSDCGQGFMNESRLKAHIKWVHDKPQKTYKCSKCDESFPSEQSKRKHFISSHNIYNRKCPYCSESFKAHRDRVLHLNKYHDKNINYPCSICSKVFKSASNRSKHIRYVHLKDKQIVCPLCGDMFTTTSDLKGHMIKHSGEKKHQCQVCKKAYARKKTLTEHMRIHNDDRRFVCVDCGKAFVQKCSLKGHMKTHHPCLDVDQSSTDLASVASTLQIKCVYQLKTDKKEIDDVAVEKQEPTS